jgi:type II secretory pathway component GspD/PulD (secretin)
LLSLSVTAVLVVAGLLSLPMASATRRQCLWRAAFLACALAFAGTVVGGKWWKPEPPPALPAAGREWQVRYGAIPASGVEAAAVSTGAAQDPAASPRTSGGGYGWWPGVVWAAGTALVLVWLLGGRILWWFLWRRTARPAAPEITAQVHALSARMGLHVRPRVQVSGYLQGPVACGWVHPTIGLPADFGERFSSPQQEAMLAHELAHLAAGDPGWHLMTDVVLAPLWWHPGLWWSRRQLRAASELAADEASLAVDNGPTVLAECLMDLARRLDPRPPVTWLGAHGDGFRSGLARRVKRLLGLECVAWPGPAGLTAHGVAMLGALGVGWLALGLGAWLLPRAAASPPALDLVMDIAQSTTTAIPAGTQPSRSRTEPRRSPPKSRPELAANPGPRVQAVEAPTAESAGTADQAAPASKTKPAEPAPASSSEANAEPAASLPESAAALPNPGAAEPPVHPASLELVTRTYRLGAATAPSALDEMDPAGKQEVMGERLRRFLAVAGVPLTNSGWLSPSSREGGLFQGPDGRSLIFNERALTFLLRATAQEQILAEQALTQLNQAPPQVVIEARFVEIDDRNTSGVGMNFFMGQTAVGSGTNSQPAGLFLESWPDRARFSDSTNYSAAAQTIGDYANRQPLPVFPAPTATGLSEPTVSGLLSDLQYRVVLRALESRSGVNVLSTPRVTTLSGRQAQVSLTELRSVIVGIHTNALVRPGVPKSAYTNDSPFIVETIPIGPTLDLVPNVTADGKAVDLSVNFQLVEFLGYEPAKTAGKVRVATKAGEQKVDRPLPRFRTRTLQTNARVGDGQTLVLGGIADVGTELKKDAPPAKRLVIFITTYQIDPAGNRAVSVRPSASLR